MCGNHCCRSSVGCRFGLCAMAHKMIGESWGGWTVRAIEGNSVVVQCGCGVRRKFRITLWVRKAHLTTLCRRCLEVRENKRMSDWLFAKEKR